MRIFCYILVVLSSWSTGCGVTAGLKPEDMVGFLNAGSGAECGLLEDEEAIVVFSTGVSASGFLGAEPYDEEEPYAGADDAP